MKKYIIALDQGTTSSRAMLIDRAGRPVASVQRPFPQIYPQPGWVEHDPQDILSSQLGALTELIMSSNVDTAEIDSIGITNQRETTIVWDSATGEPIMQRHRLAVPPHGAHGGGHRERPGDRGRDTSATPRASCPTPTSPPARSPGSWTRCPAPVRAPRRGSSCFGTVDSWLIWKLTGGGRARHGRAPTPAGPCSTTSTSGAGIDILLEALRTFPRPFCPRCAPLPAAYGIHGEPGARPGHPHLRAWRATSRRRSSASAASMRARRRTPTAPAAFCSCTPGTRPARASTGS